MALSRELMRRLISEEEPLAKRLKLAENAYFSIELPIIRKEDLLLEWLCNMSLTESSTWEVLKNCLKSEHINVKPEIKEVLVNTLIKEFQRKVEDVYICIIECSNLVLSNGAMQQYFINNPKTLDLTLVNSNMQLYASYKIIPNIMENIIQMHKHSGIMKNELRNNFIEYMLYPLCDIIDHKCIDNTNRVGAVTHRCLQQLIFNKTKTHQNINDSENDIDTLNSLFSVLIEKAKKVSNQSITSTAVVIFRAAAGSYKTENIKLDLILRQLLNSASNLKKDILNSLFTYLNDVNLPFDNKIDGVTLTNYFQSIIHEILETENLKSIDYEILSGIAVLNPLIIETETQNILQKIIWQKRAEELTNLLIILLNAYVLLRREQKFISQILMALKTSEKVDSKFKKTLIEFFPVKFKREFKKIAGKITPGQGIATLETLIFHLNVEKSNSLMIKATVELLVSFLEAIPVLEYSGTVNKHKFINSLKKLKNILISHIDLNFHEETAKHILKAILLWCELTSVLEHYISHKDEEKLTFSITNDQWQFLYTKIKESRDMECVAAMNKLILHNFKANANHDLNIRLQDLIGNFEYSWKDILKYSPETILLLKKKEISKLTYFLVKQIVSKECNLDDWLNISEIEILQENKLFVLNILSHILSGISFLIPSTTTGFIISVVNLNKLSEMVENGQILSTLKDIKDKVEQAIWDQVDENKTIQLKLYLEILLSLPLIYLNCNIRMLIFAVIYAINKECKNNLEIVHLCDKILLDLSEKSGLDLFQFIEPSLLINDMEGSKGISKAINQSLKLVTSYKVLNNCIACCKKRKKLLRVFFQCFEQIRSKLNANQKLIFRKAEKKCFDLICQTLTTNIIEADELQILTQLLKIALADGEINTDLTKTAQVVLQNVFSIENNAEIEHEKFINNGLQLAIVILRNRAKFSLNELTIKLIWNRMLTNAHENLILILLEFTEVKELQELLKQLEQQLVKDLSNHNKDSLRNTLIVWNTVMKADMSFQRNKFRVGSIDCLYQIIQSSAISKNHWHYIIQLFRNILNFKHLHLTENIIDMSILITIRSINESQILACEDALAISASLIKVRTSFVTDKLPAFLLIYRRVMDVIVSESRKANDQRSQDQCRCLALDIEKFTNSLIKLKRDMSRLSPYIVADFLKIFSEGITPIFVKPPLENCLAQLISICDQHAIAFLSRALPISLQEIFKTHMEMFKKFYKFTGKI
ncbi:uncharacterized protein [Prorops nasuta]|uniref:uncharacterized protein isoform X2 n=1 Tax=Prorops nasuta TaxID=863751 RepID=UPI0034CF358C